MTGLERLIDQLLLTTQSRLNRIASLEREEKIAAELAALKRSTQRLCKELENRPIPQADDPKASRRVSVR